MLECTEVFWHNFYKGAGVTLSVLLPLGLIWGGIMLAFFRLQYRHEEAMQAARVREHQVRDAPYRVIQGGQG